MQCRNFSLSTVRFWFEQTFYIHLFDFYLFKVKIHDNDYTKAFHVKKDFTKIVCPFVVAFPENSTRKRVSVAEHVPFTVFNCELTFPLMRLNLSWPSFCAHKRKNAVASTARGNIARTATLIKKTRKLKELQKKCCNKISWLNFSQRSEELRCCLSREWLHS